MPVARSALPIDRSASSFRCHLLAYLFAPLSDLLGLGSFPPLVRPRFKVRLLPTAAVHLLFFPNLAPV